MDKSTTTSKAWLSGVVHWFDATSGEGVIKDASGKSYFVHYSAIQTKDTWKTLKDKSPVKFKLVKDTTFSQVSHIKEL